MISNTPLALLWLFLLTSFMVVPSQANLVYSSNATDTEQHIEHNKPPKKKQAKKRLKRTKQWWASFKHPSHTKAVFNWGMVLTITLVVLIALSLFFPGVAFIVGGVSGMVGWWIAGSIVAGIWLILCHIFFWLDPDYAGPAFALTVFVPSVILYASLLIWALVTMMPLLVTLSVIFGSIALVGILIYVIKQL